MASFLDKMADAAGRAASATAQATEAAVDKGRQKWELRQLQTQLARQQRQLGMVVYTLRKTSSDNDGLIDQYIAEIDVLKNKINELRRKTEDVQMYVCPNCGRGVREGSTFCSSCGTKLSK